MTDETTPREIELERQIIKLKKINIALMERVERSMDLQGSAFSMSQTAIILEQKVRERTLDFERAMEKLEEAKCMAEQANLSKTRFLAAASHDLLQPLSAARLFAAALSERRLAPANQDLSRRIIASLNSVESILTSLLDISRLEAGVLPVSIQDFKLAELFSVLAEEFSVTALRKDIALRWVGNRVILRSDPRLLARILRNYISNALRYTEAGGRVLVGCRRSGGQIMIGVWDTGCGIPEDKFDEIFEEFHQLAENDGKSERGIGLGLTIVQRIADTLGHSLEIRSRVGRGSLFGIVVPLSAESAPLHQIKGQMPPVAAIAVLRGAKIAVIENDPDVLDGLRILLGNWGCQIIGGASGAEALAEISRRFWTPDLIIADYQLDHGETGVEAARRLREGLGADIPVVIISANTSQDMMERIRATGGQFLSKPVQKGPLRSLLAHLLKSRLPTG